MAESVSPCPHCAGDGAAFGVTASSGKLVMRYACRSCGRRWDIEYPDLDSPWPRAEGKDSERPLTALKPD
jgi:hypothetical protein